MSLPPSDWIGDPDYPAPWTTATPREGLRQNGQARIVCLAPDVCKSPSVPVPYMVYDTCDHAANYTQTVRFTAQDAMVLRSNTTHVHGDEPGVGKGVKSGTVGGISEPIGHAAQVRAEGSPVIRHLDRFWMNNRNTMGEALFVRDMQAYAPPVDSDPLPGSLRLADASDDWGRHLLQAQPSPQPAPAPAAPAPRPPGQVLRPAVPQWQGPPRPAPAPAPAPRPVHVPGIRRLGVFGVLLSEAIREMQLPDDVAAAEGRAMTVIQSPPSDMIITDLRLLGGRQHEPNPLRMFDREHWQGKYGIIIQAEDRIPLANDILTHIAGRPMDVRTMTMEEVRSLMAAAAAARAAEAAQGVRINERERYRRRCEVGPYSRMRTVCGQYGMQAHHIVPDWTLRYGARNDATSRIPNMPSLGDGMTICVTGNAATQGSEHNEAHAADGAIERLAADATPAHTATVAGVTRESVKAMVAVRPDCAVQIAAAVAGQFGTRNPAQLLRAKRLPPLPSETITALRSGATAPRP